MYYLLFLCLTLISAFNPENMITRRNLLIGCLSSSICPRKAVYATTVDNPPLTPAEMEEYNRLLKEAKRIQQIIDVNIKAANRTLEDDLFKLKK